jgi:hypothetical protein
MTGVIKKKTLLGGLVDQETGELVLQAGFPVY